MRQVLYQSFEKTRTPPINNDMVGVQEFVDLRMVGNESEEIYMNSFENIRVNYEVFLKRRFKILPESFGDTWQNQVYNHPLYLLKNNLKDVFRIRVYYDEILWPFDTFSTGGYFHWITEILPRILAFKKKTTVSCPILVPEYFLINWPVSKEIFEVFKLDVIILYPYQIAHIRKIFQIGRVGGPIRIHPEPINEGVNFLKGKFIQKDSFGTSKLYLTRNKNRKRRIINEHDVLKVLKSFDYETIDCENSTLKDQINIFSKACKVVSLHGAGLANIAFMPPKSDVIEIRQRHKTPMLNFFWDLSDTFNHRYFVVFGDVPDGYSSPFETRPEDQSLLVDIEMLISVLKASEEQSY